MQGQQFPDRRAGSPGDRILLNGHDRAMPLGKGDQQLLIQGLDEAHIDQTGIEPLGNLVRALQQRTEYQQRQPAAALAAYLRTSHG